ncbi:MAG: hypothetical protein COB42_05630 [Sulfurimonas sp.]|nr:MAG: hypothetical protein COB42_05630 [Sulfurimonas sp.]
MSLEIHCDRRFEGTLIRELYKDFNIIKTKEIEYTLGKNAHGKAKAVREIYITNYEIKKNLFSF